MYKAPAHRGFTLIELLMSVSILAIVVSITITTFLQFTQKRTEIQIEQQLYENSRFVMEKIVKEIRENTVDYEEYWNRTMTVAEGGEGFTWYGNRSQANPLDPQNNFYFCSTEVSAATDVYVPSDSIQRQKQTYYPLGRQVENSSNVYTLQSCIQEAMHKQLYGQLGLLHWNFGQPNRPSDSLSALDDEELGTSYVSIGDAQLPRIPLVTLPEWTSNSAVSTDPLDTIYDGSTSFFDELPAHLKQNELYLINGDGTKRIVMRLRPNNTCGKFPKPAGIDADICPDSSITAVERPFLQDKLDLTNQSQWIPQFDGSLEKLELLGMDYGLDNNKTNFDEDGTQYDGKVETWTCHPEYSCAEGKATNDTLNPFAGGPSTYIPTTRDMGFQPITSADISIKELSFYINPINSPEYAWGTDNPLVQNHPQIRVVLTVVPGYDLRRRLHGNVPEVTLITTVSSRVY